MAPTTKSLNSDIQTTSPANTDMTPTTTSLNNDLTTTSPTDPNMASTNESSPKDIRNTTGMSSTTSHQAAHAVMFTNELLCSIVGHLPFHDIVAATGTCKFWREALKTDSNIQEALFLKPAEVRKVMVLERRLRSDTDPIDIDNCIIIGELHPSLRRICGAISDFRSLNPSTISPSPFPKFEHADGTWRKMLITQTPCNRVSISAKPIQPESGFYCITVENDTGIRFGELYDSIHANSRIGNGSVYLSTFSVITDEWDVDKDSHIQCEVRDGQVCRPAQLPKRRMDDYVDGSDDSDYFFDIDDDDDDDDDEQEQEGNNESNT